MKALDALSHRYDSFAQLLPDVSAAVARQRASEAFYAASTAARTPSPMPPRGSGSSSESSVTRAAPHVEVGHPVVEPIHMPEESPDEKDRSRQQPQQQQEQPPTLQQPPYGSSFASFQQEDESESDLLPVRLLQTQPSPIQEEAEEEAVSRSLTHSAAAATSPISPQPAQ